MSFILDALKKADQERSRVPTLATVHGPARETMRAVGPWVVAGVILAAGGLLIWLLWPSPNVAPSSATDVQTRISTPPPASGMNPGRRSTSTAPGDGLPPASVARVPQRQDTAQQRGGSRQMASPPQVPPRSIQAPPTDLSAPQRQAAGADAATPSQRQLVETKAIEPRGEEAPFVAGGSVTPTPGKPSPPGQVEPSQGALRAQVGVVAPASPSLPTKLPTLQEAMAKMTLDVFVYTPVTTDRMVVINGRRYVQGQYVDGLYLLEEITPEGVMLSYQGGRALLRP